MPDSLDRQKHAALLERMTTSQNLEDLRRAVVEAFEHAFAHIEKQEQRIAELATTGGAAVAPPVKRDSPPPYR